jgi:Tfp pilus assembly protein PilN
MTATISRPPATQPYIWNSMPGWGIVADLTPPELVAARRLNVLRKVIGAGLLLVVVLCAAGYVWAWSKHSSATSSLQTATARTQQLTAQQNQYADVTQAKNATATINTEIASLMTQDVDVAKLVAQIDASVPPTAGLTTLTVSFTQSTLPGAVNEAPSLDRSGHAQIGTISMTGSGRSLTDITAFINHLTTVPGVTNVIPNTNARQGQGSTTFTVSLDITDVLYTHRYTAAGGH